MLFLNCNHFFNVHAMHFRIKLLLMYIRNFFFGNYTLLLCKAFSLSFKMRFDRTCYKYSIFFLSQPTNGTQETERNNEKTYFKQVLIRLADLRWDGRFGFENAYVNLLSISILNMYEQPKGMGLGYTNYIKVRLIFSLKNYK